MACSWRCELATEQLPKFALEICDGDAQRRGTEEPVRAGIEEKLEEILALLSRFRYQDRETRSP